MAYAMHETVPRVLRLFGYLHQIGVMGASLVHGGRECGYPGPCNYTSQVIYEIQLVCRILRLSTTNS